MAAAQPQQADPNARSSNNHQPQGNDHRGQAAMVTPNGNDGDDGNDGNDGNNDGDNWSPASRHSGYDPSTYTAPVAR